MCGRVKKLNTGRSSRASLKLHGHFKLYFQTMMVKHPSMNNQVLLDLSDWLNGNWTTKFLAEDVIWLWKYADVEYQPCFRFSIPYIQVKRVHMSESGICHYCFFLALRCNSDNECRQFKTNLFYFKSDIITTAFWHVPVAENTRKLLWSRIKSPGIHL